MFDSRFPRPETHDALPGIVIYPFIERRITRLCIEPGGRFPMHSHACGTEMTVVAGSGEIVFPDASSGGEYWDYSGGEYAKLKYIPTEFDIVRLTPGDYQRVEANVLHGMQADEFGLVIEIPWKEEWS